MELLQKEYVRLGAKIETMNTLIKETQDEIKIIVDSGFNSIIKLIEFINFNINRPENHTFCTTSLNNKSEIEKV